MPELELIGAAGERTRSYADLSAKELVALALFFSGRDDAEKVKVSPVDDGAIHVHLDFGAFYARTIRFYNDTGEVIDFYYKTGPSNLFAFVDRCREMGLKY